MLGSLGRHLNDVGYAKPFVYLGGTDSWGWMSNYDKWSFCKVNQVLIRE